MLSFCFDGSELYSFWETNGDVREPTYLISEDTREIDAEQIAAVVRGVRRRR